MPQDRQWIDQTLSDNSSLEFVQRILDPSLNVNPVRNEDGSTSSHSMAAEVDDNGRWSVFPTISNNNGRLERMRNPDGSLMSGQQARAESQRTGQYIDFGQDGNSAINFSQNYKPQAFKDYHQPKKGGAVVNVKGLGLMRVAQQSQPQATAGINARADKQRAMQDAIGGAFSSVMPPVDDMRDMLEDPDLLKQALDDKFQEVRGFVDMATQGLTPVQKAAFLTMGVNGLGDLAGLAADMEMYITDPESRTWFNATMSGVGVAGGAMSVSPSMAAMLPIIRKNIDAWHESPRLFHGTAGDVRRFDPSMGGSVTKARSAKEGTWLVDNPEVAGGYARLAAEDMPVQKLVDASQAAERRGDWDAAHDLMAQAEKLEQSGDLVGGGGQNIMPLRVRGNLMEVDADGATMSDLDDAQLFNWSREAKKEGFDGLKVKNFSDNADYGIYTPADHYLIFDPDNIASDINPVQRQEAVSSMMGGDTASRMARADEGGFDTDRVVYRGQHQSHRLDDFNQKLEGFSESMPETRRGISVSTDPRVADQFAGYSPEQAGTVYPMYANTQDTFDFRNPDHLARLEKHIPEEGFSFGGQHPEKPTLMARIADGGHVTIEQPLVNQAMKDAGFDSTLVREGFESTSGKMASDLIGKDHYDTINMNVFDGSQLRSVNAQFDPNKASSSDLLAGFGGAAVSGAALNERRKRDEEI